MRNNLTISLGLPSINDDYRTLAQDVLEIFEKVVLAPPPLGIKPLLLTYSSPTPVCFIDNLPKEEYWIGVVESPVKSDYCKFVYQFSHEVCHIYCNPLVNNWFVESLCELSSNYCLEEIGKKWLNVYKWPWGTNFSKYREEKVVKRFLEDDRLKGYNLNDAWLKKEIKSLKGDVDRPLNFAVAHKLFDLFNNNPNYWKILPLLSSCTDAVVTEIKLYSGSKLDFEMLEKKVKENGIDADVKKIYDLLH